LGMLLGFKYFNFVNGEMRRLFEHFTIDYPVGVLKVMLPVGISFYTFQTLSYTIDVYRGQRGPERHLGIFALYVAFFPQLVAGPIERSTRLMPQLRQAHEFDYDRVTSGLKLMAWGFFQKLVIADRLAVYVNGIYNSPGDFHGWRVLLASYLFAFQIYCDFAAYSDIAIGTARILGFNLMENFRRPYFATSIRDFWSRWHISLTTWFRDYLYIPLGGNRVGKTRWYFNLFIVFVISGFWHGANWTFLAWGALHGLYLMAEMATTKLRARVAGALRLDRVPRLHAFLKGMITFHLVCLGLVIFRANKMGDVAVLLRNLFQSSSGDPSVPMRGSELRLGVLAVIVLLVVHALEAKEPIAERWARRPVVLRMAGYCVLVLSILVFGVFGGQEFIYFQF
jgi:alginate O-acetyltransferase complex protein AlgI